ncbi:MULTISPECIES: hypothetical protein [Clostridium]|uniref:Uncharacterized protein n=1 Tax=Clostridium cibarium TaxID=2762247 RepID=A0ABR8PYM3_9CLOT|nr:MULTISPECIES: hypothetical protein [Clostridium]MBD7913262.1 hypothetical protein [Clostridium cibarium]
MAQILIRPEDLQKEITSSRGTNGKVKALKYSADKKNIQLQSIDKFLECLEALNSALAQFGDITEIDLHTLEIVKANWMKLDDDIASKTIFNRTTDAVNKLISQ